MGEKAKPPKNNKDEFRSPIGQLVVVVGQVAVAKVTGLEVGVVEALDELDARGGAAAQAGGGAPGGRRVGPAPARGHAPLVHAARRGGGVARLQPWRGLAVAPGQRRGAVGQAGHAAGGGVVAVVARRARLQAAGEGRDRRFTLVLH